MAFEQKNMEGALFKNDRRETDQHPNMRGSCTIEGTKYWISAWTNEVRSGDRAGQRYQSLKFTKADNQPSASAPRREAAPPPEDDDIPF